MLIKRNILAIFAMSFMASATASEFSLGAGAVYNESPYRGYNENVHAVPLISYESESFYFRQTSLGYILSKNEKNEFSVIASWMPLEFDPADNDEHDMKQLDKRDSTAMVGAAWYHHEKWGSVKVSAAADVLDNSNGWVGEVSVFRQCLWANSPLRRLPVSSITTKISTTTTTVCRAANPAAADCPATRLTTAGCRMWV